MKLSLITIILLKLEIKKLNFLISKSEEKEEREKTRIMMNTITNINNLIINNLYDSGLWKLEHTYPNRTYIL